MSRFTSFGAFDQYGWYYDFGTYSASLSDNNVAVLISGDGTRTVFYGTNLQPDRDGGVTWTTLSKVEHTNASGSVVYERIDQLNANVAGANGGGYNLLTSGQMTFVGSANRDVLFDVGRPAGTATFTGGGGADVIQGAGGAAMTYILGPGDFVAGESISGPSTQGVNGVLALANAGSVDLTVGTVDHVPTIQFQSGTSSVTVAGTQFESDPNPGGFTSIIGSAGVDALTVIGATGNDLSGLPVSNWTSGQDTFTVVAGDNNFGTVKGPSDVDTIFKASGFSGGNLFGGAGNDTFILTNSASSVNVNGGGGTNTLQLNASTATLNVDQAAALSSVVFGTGASTAAFTPGPTVVGVAQVTGGANVDTITAFGHSVDLSGIAFSNWTDGVDKVLISTDAGGGRIGSSKADTFVDYAAGQTVDGGAGYDTINLGGSTAGINGATDAQIVNVEAVSAAAIGNPVTIDLHNQSEGFSVTGSAYDDTINGGGGNDTINGGGGSDTLDGGAGIDTAQFSSSRKLATISHDLSGHTLVASGGNTQAILSNFEHYQFTDSLLNNPSTAHDFGGDGHADILYRQNSSGNTVLAQLNGSHAAAPSAFTDVQLGPDWNVVSTASDFNNDGHADILYRNVASGATILSEMNGAHQAAPSAFTDVQVNNSYAIAGTADFNGDGNADILYRNVASGQTVLSELNGSHQAAPSAFTDVQLDNSFAVAGTGDFNGDGKADILYRKASSGSTLIAFQNGPNQAAPSAFTDVQVGNDYKVWVGDFDGDGKSDLLFRNVNTGQTAVSLMDGSHQKAPTAFTDVQLNNQFEIAQVSDFNGDGTADILFRNATSGATLVAFMNGAHQAAPSAFTDVQVDHSWSIV